LKIVFMGTSDFAVPSLEQLIASDYDITGVITQPDRVRGRGKKIGFSPIKEVALKHEIPVSQPEKIKDHAAIEQIKNWQPDLIVVVSYGQIIPEEIIHYPRYGCINVHASLLPRYRGAAPIQRSLMNGEKLTGVTTMFMDEGLDTGDIILQLPVPIGDDYDHGKLKELLAEKGGNLLIETIEQVLHGTAPRLIQDERQANYAHRIMAADEMIDWLKPAINIHNQIRALSPSPGAWFWMEDHKVKIFKSRVIDTEEKGVIAQIVETNNEGFRVQCGSGVLEVLEVQREGKKRLAARDFLRGYKLNPGTVLAHPEG
jgi:methionyl-tRNA formyltransferase